MCNGLSGFGLDIGVHNFIYRIWIGFGVDEKVSDWIRIAKFPYPYTTAVLNMIRIAIQPDSVIQNRNRIGLDFEKTQPDQSWLSKVH